MRIARQYIISGRVQRVGFRYFTQAAASRESLDGWVSNRPDGTVEAAAAGEVEAVDRFERAIRRGPDGARVDRVDVHPLPAVAPGTGFHIR